MAEAEMNVQRGQEIGAMIRKFRLLQIQMDSGSPWTQDDLAVAIGSDKAYISRLENGKQIPNPKTLKRICEALNLTWDQRRQLLVTAGYLTALPAPSDSDVERAIGFLRPHLDKLVQPAVLHDREAIMWDLNDLEAYTFYGYKNREVFLDDCQGLRVIELLMTSKFNNWFQKTIVDYESYARRQILRFKELYVHRQGNEEYQNLRKRLLEISDFRHMWNDLEEHKESVVAIPFINHQIMEINHPDIGKYSIQIWHCDVSFDERFAVVQHIANDPSTQQLFTDLWKRFQR